MIPYAKTWRSVSTLAFVFLSISRCFCLDADKTLTQFAHRTWGLEEGLFQPTIYSVAQTADGFLWLGTQDSLIRFDGMHFREWEHGGRTWFHGSLVHSLLPDKDGGLWIGSIGAGMAHLQPNGDMEQFTKESGFPSENVWCLASEKSGAILACTDKGLVRWDGVRWRVFSRADGLAEDFMRSACVSTDGTRWVAGMHSSLGYSKGDRFETYTNPELPHGLQATTLSCASDGSVWAGSDAGLTQIQGNSVHSFGKRGELLDGSVSSLTEAPDGGIWVGTNDGISRMAHGEVDHYRTEDGLSHSLVLCLFFDHEGSLWAGTKDGLDQFTDAKVTPYTTAQGMSSNDAGPIVQSSNGKLWVGTADAGLNVFDGHHFSHLTARNGLSSNRILSLETGLGDELWVGTSNGADRLRNGRVVTRGNGLAHQEVRALYKDREGQLWAGSDSGLYRWTGVRFVSSGAKAGLSDGEGMLALTGSEKSRLIASSGDGGLILLRGSQFERRLLTGISRPVDCYLVDAAHHSVWMGTLGSGLLRWHDGKVAQVHVKDGLYDNRIYSILEDDQRNFWMASSKGIFRVGDRELESFADGKTHSINSIPFSTGQLRFECRAGVQPAACRTRDGRLWFATTSGLVVVDPNRLQQNRVPPPVQITSLVVDGQRLDPEAKLQLKHTDKNLEIRYAGLSFLSPEKLTFRYRLSPYEKGWTDAGSRREAFFTTLPPGNFHFEVLARSADGVWSRQPAFLNLRVLPLFYQRPWFQPALVLLLLGIATLIYRARVRRLQLGFELVLAERSRIARELHDTLLQGLSGITMQLQALWTGMSSSEQKQELYEIIGDAARCSTEARRSLWGLRTGVPPLSNLADRLAEAVRESVDGSAVELRLELQPVPFDVSPTTEHQLLRITGEAVANALQHATATSLTVRLAIVEDQMTLTVGDDGIGFEAELVSRKSGHFGLTGMQERADEIGAALAVESSPLGTVVSVRVPMTRLKARRKEPSDRQEHPIH